MDHVEGNALPKEKSISDPVCIQNVSEYLGYILSIVLRQVFEKNFMPISVTLPRIVPLMFCNQRFPLDNR